MRTNTESSYEELVQKMNDKSKELDTHICKLKKSNDELRSRSISVLDSLKALVGTVKHPPKSCNVCYSRPRTYCVLPCGHASYCEGCAERARSRGGCFTCRQAIEQIVKIYLWWFLTPFVNFQKLFDLLPKHFTFRFVGQYNIFFDIFRLELLSM